ncbi:putative phage abortive infection protein [Pontibacter sp. CAU 1760]
MKLSRYELTGYILIAAGAVVLVWGAVKFDLLHELYLDPLARKGGVLGELGEFIGGIVGSLWALAGVFLFFATLTYQKREFELQRRELHKTQKIYQQQNFSTLYISFIGKHNDIIDSLTAYDINQSEWSGTNFFVFFQEKVLTSFVQKVRALAPEDRTPENLHSIFREYFTYHFSFYQSSLAPYLKNLSVLFKLIQRYRSETEDAGEYYSFITKASFTQSELFLIYHVAQFGLIKEFSAFDDAFDVFEDLVEEYKVTAIVQNELPLR